MYTYVTIEITIKVIKYVQISYSYLIWIIFTRFTLICSFLCKINISTCTWERNVFKLGTAREFYHTVYTLQTEIKHSTSYDLINIFSEKKKSKNFDAQSGMVQESLFCSKIIILFLHLELQLFFCCQRVYVFIKIHTRLKCSVLILYITLDCISPSDSDVCKQGHNKFNS